MVCLQLNSETPEQLMSQIDEICGSELHVFRGENFTYDYVSSPIFRKYKHLFLKGSDFIPLDVEKEIVDRARKMQFSENTPVSEILTDIRHFGGDTTLIDFTRSLPVALFFGCSGRFDDDGRIIAMPTKSISSKFNYDRYDSENYSNEKAENKKVEMTNVARKAIRKTEKELSILYPSRTVISRARTEFQSSVFIHAPTGYIDETESGCISIIIPKNMKWDCLQYLDRRHNIRYETIYNDLTGYIEIEKIWEKSLKWFYFGLSRMRNEKYEKAIICFDRSIRHNPKIASVWYNRGKANVNLGNTEDADYDFNRAVELQ